jgi:hypothetical protein
MALGRGIESGLKGFQGTALRREGRGRGFLVILLEPRPSSNTSANITGRVGDEFGEIIGSGVLQRSDTITSSKCRLGKIGNRSRTLFVTGGA